MYLPHLPSVWASGVACAVALALGGAALPALAQTPPPAVRAGAPVTLNFVEADIVAVARAMAAMLGRNVVVDPRVSGTLTLQTERNVTPANALQLFGAALRLRGFAVIDSAGLIKVVPEADARLHGGAVLADDQLPRGQQIVTQIFTLTHENANHLLPLLRPLISANNPINVNPGNNSLVITDYAENLRRAAQIIAALDVANATGLEVIPLQHALASELAPVVLRLIDAEGAAVAATAPGQPGGQGFRTVLLAEPRSNALILRAANPARVALVRSLVAQLDRPASAGAQGNIHVVHLRNANAAELATTLRAALAADAGDSVGTAAGAGTAPAAAPAAARRALAGAATGGAGAAAGAGATQAAARSTTGGQIQADAATNSLIISAPEPVFRQLRAIIEQLDTRRAQVFVESVIAEVSADAASEFGIQWQQAIGGRGDSTIGILGTNFGNAGSNIINLATQNMGAGLMPAAGLNLGLVQRVGGTHVLTALARFLEQSGQANILSTPNLLTLDNEEARIVVGQNVPFVTGSFTNAGGQGGAVNPFQTIERRDVGLTLRVRPQISENGTVRMAVFQEVSSIQEDTVRGPITNTRSIETHVLVDDGAIVVLGGLLQDEYGGAQDQVPGLGNVPLLGALFRSERRSRNKTNLMVFLRPVIVRDQRASDTLALDRYELMRAAQERQQPSPSAVHPINQAPALPALDLSRSGLPMRLFEPGAGAAAPVAPAASRPAAPAPTDPAAASTSAAPTAPAR